MTTQPETVRRNYEYQARALDHQLRLATDLQEGRNSNDEGASAEVVAEPPGALA